jgi:hypothetical protein
MMYRPFAISFFILANWFIPPPATAQKVLLIEKAGNPRTERISLFDEITFTLKGDDRIWYKRQILDMDVNAQLLLLGDTWTPITDISRIRLIRQRTWANLIGGALMGGGVGMILGDLWYTVARNSHRYTEGGIEFGLLNIAVGAGIMEVFSPIKYKLGDRRRLRAVDLTY